MHETHKKRIYFSIITVLFFIAIALGSVLYINSWIAKATDRIAKVKKQSHDETTIKDITNNLDLLREQAKNIDIFFIKENERIYFIESIENISRNRGTLINIDSVNLLKHEDKDDNKKEEDKKEIRESTLEMNITIIGFYTAVLNVLKDIENLPYNIEIEVLRLNQDIDKEKNLMNTWTLNVGFSVTTILP
jgi:cell division protein FtsB